MSLFIVWCRLRDAAPPDQAHLLLEENSILSPANAAKAAVLCGKHLFHVHIQAATSAFYSPSSYVDADGFTVFCGLPWIVGDDRPQVLDAKGLSRHFSNEIAGEFGVVRITDELIAFSDPSGIQPLYYYNDGDIFAISNRVSMIKDVTGADFYPEGAVGIISVGYRIGCDTPVRGVRRIPQNCKLTFDGKVTITPNRRSLFSEGIGFDRVSDFGERLDAGIKYAIQAIMVANPGDAKIRLPITGGKDSRVVLALCLAAGLKERMELFTRGPEDHPDVVVGKSLAEAVGVPFVGQNAAADKPPEQIDPDDLLRRIAIHAFLNDSLISAWDLHNMKSTGLGVQMTGHMGEVLKSNIKKPPSSDTLVDRVNQTTTLDSLGVLTPDSSALLAATIMDRMEPLMSSRNKIDTADVFYYSERIPNWLGAFSPTSTLVATRVRPLNSPDLLSLAWSMTAEERKAELIHFHIIKRLRPDLLNLPFASQTWSPLLTSHFEGLNVTKRHDLPDGSATKLFGGWQLNLNNRHARDAIESMFSNNRDSSLWSVVDYERVIANLNGGNLSLPGMIRMLGLLSLFFTERGWEERQTIKAASAHPPYGHYC